MNSTQAGTQKIDNRKRPKLALLIAAHNEELVIEKTIRSAINAGMKPENIYVVDDNSTDKTKKIAADIIGKNNVCKVRRSGKGLALTKAAKKFELSSKYQWIHIADADGGFASDYFYKFRKNLRIKYAAATGYVKSLPGTSIGEYRVYEYTIGMELHRRFQSLVHTVSVIPGPTSCFRSDIFDKLNFANNSFTEDFDVTLQLHRKNLGKIQFITSAVAFTQDPRTTKDYVKQITRWNRGTMQGIKRHKIGFKPNRIDLYLSYQVMTNMLFFINYFVLFPIIAIKKDSVAVLAAAFLMDVTLTFALTVLVALRSTRWDILSAFPYIYYLRFVQLFVFLKAMVEILILDKFKSTGGTWSTSGRRYKQA
jgi:biofilm PGA synthesis N-glycosyltransferase PgaC